MDLKDEKIIRAMQGDIPVSPRPFAEVAAQAGLEESEVLARLRKMKERGILRRVGAILRHRKAGVTANVMCVWRVPSEMVEEVGKRFAEEDVITHCYERPSSERWPYNLYTMIHGSSIEGCRQVVEKLSRETGITEYRMLTSTKEYKKTSVHYF